MINSPFPSRIFTATRRRALERRGLNRFAWCIVFANILLISFGHRALAANGNDIWSGGTGTDWATSTDWATGSVNKPPISGDSLTFTSTNTNGNATLTNTLTTSAFNINGITFSAGAPAYTMTGNTFNLTSGITNNSGVTQTFSNAGGLTASAGYTFALGTGGAGNIVITGTLTNISGGAVTETVNGAGSTLTLGGFNVNTGVNRIVSVFNGTGNVIIGNNITGGDSVDGLTYAGTGTLTITGTDTFNGNGSSLNVSSGTLVLSGTNTGSPVAVSGTGVFNETASGAFQNNGGSTSYSQTSTGTSTLAGTNLYSGATTISAGVLNLTGTESASAIAVNGGTFNVSGLISGGSITTNGGTFNESGTGLISGAAVTVTQTSGTSTLTGKNTYGGATAVNGGVLNLDFSAAGAPATNIINSTASTSALTLGGGTLIITGSSGGTNSQRFNGTTLTANTRSFLAFNQNSATSLGTTLGNITRNAGSTVDFTLPTSGTGSLSTTSLTSATNGVLVSAATNGVAYATVGGTTWAANTSGSIGALSTYQTTYVAGSNVNVGGGVASTTDTPASAFTANTLRFNALGLALTASGTNTVTTGGILVTPAGTGAALNGGNLQAGGGKELVVIDNGSLTIGSVIQDNSTASALTLSGSGTTALGGANTYTGQTTVLAGTLNLSNALAAQNSTVQLNAGSALVFDQSVGGNAFTLGALAGAPNIALVNNGGTPIALTVGGNNASTTYSGVLSGAGSLIKNGSGTLAISTNQTYTGGLTINNGTVNAGNQITALGTSGTLTMGQAGSANSAIYNSAGNNNPITVNPGVAGTPGAATREFTPNTGSSFTLGGAITLVGGATLNINLSSATNTLTGGVSGTGNFVASGTAGKGAGIVFNTVSFNPAGLFENLNPGTGAATFNSVIGTNVTGLIENTSTSQLVLAGSNTFFGDTTITNGTVNVRNALALQNSVVVTNSTAGSLTFGTSTTVGLASATLGGLSGNGNVNLNDTLTAPGAVALTIGNSNTLLSSTNSITGVAFTNTLNPVYSGNLSNTNGAASVTKVGTNTQTFAGTETYSGATTVNLGTLQFAKEVSLYNDTTASWTAANITVASGATAAFNVGGTGEFTSSDIGTLSSLGTATTGFKSGSILGLDTTNASGAVFNYGNAIANTNGGANVLGLTKLGTNTLSLTVANTYTGPTTVANGTLQLSAAGTAGAANGGTLGATAIKVNTGGTLLLAANNAIGTSASLTLNGGTFKNAGGLNEGSAQSVVNGGTPTGTNAGGLGTLTLSAASTLDFGTGPSTLVFSSLSDGTSAPLTIMNYTNTVFNDGTQTSGVDGAEDRLIFSFDVQAAGLLGDINFGSGLTAGQVDLGGGFYEIGISAVPEPTTIFAGLLALGLVGYRERRRLAALGAALLPA